MANKALLRFAPIVAVGLVGAYTSHWPPLKFADLGAGDTASRFSVVVFFSLLIERCVEIVMAIWRSEEANRREAAVQRLIASQMQATEPVLVTAQEQLIRYKAETLQWTMPTAFTLGLIVSAFGVRVLSQFVDQSALQAMSEPQHFWFNFLDVVFTGALLAGGADPIHKILDLYRKVVESSAAKEAGTKA